MNDESKNENLDEALDEDDQVSNEADDESFVDDESADDVEEVIEHGDLSARIVELEEQLALAKEQSLRAAAEAQNARRRAEQDIEKAHKFGLEKFVNAMLPIVDNLERALDAASADGADPGALNEGVELTLKTFVDALQSHKVEQVAPEGEPFDPNLHQAISAIESPEAEPNTVLTVVQKGYTLHGRLVRPAMVVVSKA